MTRIATCIGLAIIIFVIAVVMINQAHIQRAGGELLDALVLCVRGLVIMTLLFTLVFGMVHLWFLRQRQQERLNRPKDGSFALRTYKLVDDSTLIINPNNMIAGAAIISPQDGYAELTPLAGWERQLELRKAVQITHHLQATSPGDDAIRSKFGSAYRSGRAGIPNAATAKFLAGGWEKPRPKPQLEAVSPAPTAAGAPMPARA